MGSSDIQDKRLLSRELRHGRVSRADIQKQAEALPDQAENVQRVDPEELDALRQQLESETVLRAERIERAINEPTRPEPPAPPPVPFEPDL